MIVKVLYSLGDDTGNLYLCKTPSLKIGSLQLRCFKIHREGSPKPLTLGILGLRKCLELALHHSPELFDLDRSAGEPKLRVVDYSVYHRDALEVDMPLVGHGSMKELLNSSSEDGIAGIILKKPGFLSGDSDEEVRDTFGQDGFTEEDATAYLRNNNYSLEVRLEFKKFYRNYNNKFDGAMATFNEKPPTVVTKASKKPPKASRTLSLPVFDQSMAEDSFDGFYGGAQMELRNIKPVTKKKKKTPKSKKQPTKPSVAAEFEDLPETPTCVHCATERSSQWRWHKSEKKEGLICKECSDYYRKYFKLRPLEKKTKKRKSPSSAVASPMPAKKKALGSISIAESLSAKRDLLEQQKAASPVTENNKSPSHIQTPVQAPIQIQHETDKAQDRWISQMLTKFTPDVRLPAEETFMFDETTFDNLLNEDKADTIFDTSFERFFEMKNDSDNGSSNTKTDESEGEPKPQTSSMPSSPVEGK